MRISGSLIIAIFIFSTPVVSQSWENYYDSCKFYLQKTHFTKADHWATKSQEKAGTDLEKMVKSLDMIIEVQTELNNRNTALHYLHKKVTLLKPIKAKQKEYFNALLEIAVFYSLNNEMERADSMLTAARPQAKGKAEQDDWQNGRLELLIESGQWQKTDDIIQKEGARDANLLIRKYLHDEDFSYAEEIIANYLKKYKTTSREYALTYIQLLPSIMRLLTNTEKFEAEYPALQMDSVFRFSTRIIKENFGAASHEFFELMLMLAMEYTENENSNKGDSLYQVINTLSTSTFGKNNVYAVDALLRLGGIYEESGQLIKAQHHYEQLEVLAREVFGQRSAAYNDCLQTLFGFQVQLGRKEEANKNYQTIYPIYLKEYGKLSTEYSSLISTYAILAKQDHNYTLASGLIENAIAITERGGVDCNPCYGNMLISLSEIQEQNGQYGEAEATFIKALEFLEKNISDVEDNSYYIDYKTSLADLYAHCKALRVQKQLLLFPGDTIIRRSDGKDYISSKSSHPRAVTELQVEEIYSSAIKYYTKKFSDKHPKVADLKIRKAMYLWINNETYRASREFNAGLKSYLEQIRITFPQMSEKEKTQFYNTLSDYFNAYYAFVLNQPTEKSYVYPDAIAYFKTIMGADTVSYSFAPAMLEKKQMIKIQDHYRGNLFNYRLPTKAIIINSSSTIRKRIAMSNDLKLIDDYRHWEQLRLSLARLYTGDQKTSLSKIDSTERELNAQERKLSEKSEAFKITQDEKDLTWINIQEKLKEDEAAIEIIRLHHPLFYQTRQSIYKDSLQYAVVIITKETIENPKVIILKNGYELENKFFAFYKNSITLKQPDSRSYNAYWKPIENYSIGKKVIYLSSDGVFNLINLISLKNNSGTYLLEEKDIRLVTNLKDILQPYHTSDNEKDAFILGDPDFKDRKSDEKENNPPHEQRSVDIINLLSDGVADLPGTKKEIEEIAKTLAKNGWRTKVVQRKTATEDTLKRVQNIRLIHLATHGFFMEAPDERSNENPLLRSGLLLAGSVNSTMPGSEDGILTAYEALNLNLESTELVVLSACQTGLGVVQDGEGVYGLQRAFKIAGAQAMIMSLWKVDDAATADLMSSFYSEWVITGNKRQAFVNAQKKAKLIYKDPYYWGAFIYIGE